jgi:hypothetical protein
MALFLVKETISDGAEFNVLVLVIFRACVHS